MERLDGGAQVPAHLRGGILALGNFDGFHGGHQAVVGEAIAWARKIGVPAIVATFDPHPVRFFKPDISPFRLTSLDQRQRLFAKAGADAMLVFHFDAALAATSAEAFVAELLHERFGATGVVTGEDFSFGKGRRGDVAALASLGSAYDLEARAVGPVADRDEVISSSRIREALQAGDCRTAARLLTRPWAVEGRVVHGDKNGRKLGFPTANVELGAYLRPHYGIYAVRGHMPDGRTVDGVANIGIRPTFDPPKELLEPYFFDFDDDLYGETIEVEFHRLLRDEAKFDSLDALKAQMQRDCAAAREVLASAPSLA